MNATRNTVRALVACVFVAAVAAAAVALWLGGDDEVLVPLEDVPAAAKAAILKEAENGSVRQIELVTRDGADVYCAEIIVGSTKIELEVAADGEVLDRDEEDYRSDAGEDEMISLDDAPPAVRDAILKAAAGAPITELEKKSKQGKPIYAAEFTAEGKEVEIWVDAQGTVVSREVNEPD